MRDPIIIIRNAIEIELLISNGFGGRNAIKVYDARNHNSDEIINSHICHK
jgi:hypothetical protein